MRVVYAAPTYHPHVGGVEYVVKAVAERLAKRGHEVVVLAGEPNAERPAEEEVSGVHVVRWPTWTPGGAYHVPRHRARLEEALRELLRGADVLHVHSIHAILPVWAGLKARELGFRGRLVASTHYHGTGHTPLRRALWALWRRYAARLVKAADVVHAASAYEAKLLEEHFAVRPTVVEHGVDEDVAEVQWTPRDYAMYSGRLEKYKNVEKLAAVVKALSRLGHKLRLEIYGEGPHRPSLEKALRRIGVDYSIYGFQPRRRYLEKLAGAALFGLLSTHEAYGQTANEANAIGVPTLVAKPWGEHFAARPRTLAVDPHEDAEKIAKKAARLIEEAPRQPRPRVPTWSQTVDTYLKLYTP
ncbi:glycosyltransferase family 4 protein [Pyrobaculum calidifontis]|uniref:Glycosyl transferase, group 1 n=1 Tax=Pyrobaculum calidifontis (strain DSM 21063 / JCM 11548 / VA1) TaxID=410359 RepID=A3MTD7_PYRCJ|nr:glycosyltransferase family 4 protein [Pyrobaculum calidifontis]ABO07904.1 glycosyl transferase, group 1 [Pyrobaculum calidifontis JCM 11548]